MATKYSDIVTLRESKAAYNIQTEEKGEWDKFIANEQFNDILRKVISAVYNNDADTHKSFWVEGTYGTGKSHAGAVIEHLLCDPVSDIEDYVNLEYKDDKYAALRSDIFALRKKKRLFPVTLYGQCSISHKDDLSLELQKAIKKALKNAGINIVVKTDYDNYASHVENHPEFWDLQIKNNAKLASFCPDRKKLVSDLKMQDSNTLRIAKDAVRESGLSVRLDMTNLQSWFFEVQDKLKELKYEGKYDYDGLLVLWDEFTDVMTSELGPSLLVSLQELTEAAMNSKNDSYFFFISHPSALNSLKAEERDKTKGRYHYMKYSMNPVSAFKIMSRKFKIVGSDLEYQNITGNFFMKNEDLLNIYSIDSADIESTKKDIKSLFPVHPATANLATYYAREAGSSSRSVFQFLGDNKAVRDFLNDHDAYMKRETITADYLWDYVVDEFNSNVGKFGAVTERYNSYHLHVEKQGLAYLKVFKSVLLLNALNNIANNDTVTPSETNIRNLYLGTSFETFVDDVLDWLNNSSIIQRDPTGVFSIQFSALPVKEIAEIRTKLLESDYRYTSQVINFGDSASNFFESYLKGVSREHCFDFYGVESNDFLLLNKIENGRKKAKDYELYLAILAARNNDELSNLKTIVEKAKSDERFSTTVFLIFDTTFEDNNYDRFIEYQANAKCAQQHGFADQQKTHMDFASEMIKDWCKNMRRGVVTIYVVDKTEAVSANQLPTTLSRVISPIIFSSGPESLEIVRNRAPQTSWKKQMSKDVAKAILTFNTKDDIIAQLKGPQVIMSFLLQDSIDDNLQFKSDCDSNHPLYKICQFVDRKIKNADKSQNFNLAEKLIELSKAPYGLYQTFSGIGILAFALKKYAGKIFDLQGKPRKEGHLIEDVCEVFKCWENGNTNSTKVTFKFETPEENALCKKFVDIFNLKSFKEYSDISSLKDARWAISHEFIASKGYPLWSLKYYDGSIHSMVQDSIPSNDLNTLIDNIVKICNEVGTSNPSMMSTTLELIKNWQFEFKNLICVNANYEIGFVNFLKKDENVNLQDDQVPNAIDYIKKHVQSEIGTWKEDEIRDALKNWKISTIVTTETNTPPTITPPVFPPHPAPDDKKRKAKEKAKNFSPSVMHKKIDELIDLGYNDILEIILED